MQTSRAQDVQVEDRVAINPESPYEVIGTVTGTDRWKGEIHLTLDGHALIKLNPHDVVGVL